MSLKRLVSVSSHVGEKYVLGGERSSRSSAQPLSHAVDELGGDLPRNGVPFLDVPNGSHTPVASPRVTQAPYLVPIQRTLREHAIDRQTVGLPEEHAFLLALRHRTLSTICYPPDRQQHGENNQEGQLRIGHRSSFRER